MIPLTFGILTVLLVASAVPITEKPLSKELHEEFTNYSIHSLHMIGGVPKDSHLRYITVTVWLTDCSAESFRDSVRDKEKIELEEQTCGTQLMRDWCEELPGRSVNLMTKYPNSNISFMATFQCVLSVENYTDGTRTKSFKWVFSGLVVVCVLGVMYNFRTLYKGQYEKRKHMNMSLAAEHLMEDSSIASDKKKKNIRSAENSDMSIGKVFTL